MLRLPRLKSACAPEIFSQLLIPRLTRREAGARRRCDWQEDLRAWRVPGWSPRRGQERRSTPCRRLRNYGSTGSRDPFPAERSLIFERLLGIGRRLDFRLLAF